MRIIRSILIAQGILTDLAGEFGLQAKHTNGRDSPFQPGSQSAPDSRIHN